MDRVLRHQQCSLVVTGALTSAIFMRLIWQTYTTKPVNISLSNVFVQLAVWLCGIAWARLLPTEDVVANRPRLHW